jgi:hypothetical protein
MRTHTHTLSPPPTHLHSVALCRALCQLLLDQLDLCVRREGVEKACTHTRAQAMQWRVYTRVRTRQHDALTLFRLFNQRLVGHSCARTCQYVTVTCTRTHTQSHPLPTLLAERAQLPDERHLAYLREERGLSGDAHSTRQRATTHTALVHTRITSAHTFKSLLADVSGVSYALVKHSQHTHTRARTHAKVACVVTITHHTTP